MNELLANLLLASLQVALVTIALLLMGPALRSHTAARWRVALWLLLALRLLVPFNPSLPGAPVQVVLPVATAGTAAGETAGNNGVQAPTVTSLPTGAEPAAAPPLLPAAEKGLDLPRFLFTLWLAGAVCYSVWQLGVWLRFARMVRQDRRQASPDTEELLARLAAEAGLRRPPAVYYTKAVSCPVLVGLLRPSILLPPDTRPEGLDWMLRHELAHLARGDVWAKQLLLAAKLVHWFNPFVHLMAAAAGRDIEIACDSRALRGHGAKARLQYGQTLLAAVPIRPGHLPGASTHFVGGAFTMKQRLAGLFQKPGKRGLVVLTGVLACLLLLCCCTAVQTGGALPAANDPSVPVSPSQTPAASLPGTQSPEPERVVIPEDARIDPETGLLCADMDGERVYFIQDAAELEVIGDSVDTLAAHYVQVADIHLEGEWEPIGTQYTPFSGHYDGNGYRIAGLYVSADTWEPGLFGCVENGVLVNITLQDPWVAGTEESFPFAGSMTGSVGRDLTVLRSDEPAASGVVTVEDARILYYTDGDRHPYVNLTVTNGTDKDIAEMNLVVLAYDAEGNALELDWYAVMGGSTPSYSNHRKSGPASWQEPLAGGETRQEGGGWSLPDGWQGGETHLVAYILTCVTSVTFTDVSHWENPEAAAWLEAYEGRNLDTSFLENHYPYSVTLG